MDKDLLKQKMKKVFADFKTAVQQHPDINIKRADGGWTVGEIAGHIIKATSTDLGRTKKTERAFDKNAASIKELFLDFSQEFPSAPELEPAERTYTKEEIFSSLDKNLAQIIEMIDKQDLTETCIDWEVPGWGNLTKYECVVLFEFHTIRHTKQVNDFNAVREK